MKQSLESLLAASPKDVRIAVVGASSNPEKFGYRIVSNLRRKGYAVLPVNPREHEVDGLAVSPSVDAIEGRVDIVDFVVPPPVTRSILAALDPSRFPVVWLQPGAFDEEVSAYARARFETVVDDACIMVATHSRRTA